MGSSGKSRRHYKKDSRFVADLYTLTYDKDFDLVSGARTINQCIFWKSDVDIDTCSVKKLLCSYL